jgi:hypothetical protein
MKIKFIESWKFKLRGRVVPVIVAQDISAEGKIGSLFIAGKLGKRDNSLVNAWDEKGYEINRNAMAIPVTDEKGLVSNTFVVSDAGQTINLYTDPRPKDYPNWATLLGKLFMADDIADNMTLGKSMKNIVIGLIIGALVGTFLLGPMVTAMMK